MVPFRRSTLSDVLRVALAALVLLAGVASARMQGQAGDVLLSSGVGAVLCSGTSNPDAPQDGAPVHAHGACVLCQIVGAPVPSMPALPLRFATLSQQDSAVAVGAVGQSATRYQARGPPRFG